MPRKTIAGLEAEIVKIKEILELVTTERDQWREACESERQRTAGNVYIAYHPSGDNEVDALQVAARAIGSLYDDEAMARCGRYLAARFPEPDVPRDA